MNFSQAASVLSEPVFGDPLCVLASRVAKAYYAASDEANNPESESVFEHSPFCYSGHCDHPELTVGTPAAELRAGVQDTEARQLLSAAMEQYAAAIGLNRKQQAMDWHL